MIATTTASEVQIALRFLDVVELALVLGFILAAIGMWPCSSNHEEEEDDED